MTNLPVNIMPTRPGLLPVFLLAAPLLLTSFGSHARFLNDPAAAVNYFRDALAQGNTGAALSMLAADATFFEQGDAQESREAYASSRLRRDAALLSSRFAEIISQKTDSDGTLAWISTRLRLLAKETVGDSASIVMTETVVLRRVASGWTIVHVHRSAEPTASEAPDAHPVEPAGP
jgi:ketosteroid isomerase-like protein